MKYSTVVKSIQTGDVLSFEGTAFYSKFLKMFTRSDITHSGIALWVRFPNGDVDRLFVMESHALKGVQMKPLADVLERDYWFGKGGKCHWQPITDPDIKGTSVAAYTIRMCGLAYASWYQFVLAGSRVLRFLRMIRGASLNTDSRRFHCSELVTKALIANGYEHDKDPGITTPADVSKFTCLGNKVVLEPDYIDSTGFGRVRREPLHLSGQSN